MWCNIYKIKKEVKFEKREWRAAGRSVDHCFGWVTGLEVINLAFCVFVKMS